MRQIKNGDDVIAAMTAYLSEKLYFEKKIIVIIFCVCMLFGLSFLVSFFSLSNAIIVIIVVSVCTIGFYLFSIIERRPDFKNKNGQIKPVKIDILSLYFALKCMDGAKCVLQADDTTIFTSFFIKSNNMTYKEKDIEEIIEYVLKELLAPNGLKEIYNDFSTLSPLLLENGNLLGEDLNKIIESEIVTQSNLLPSDIKNKGVEMSEVYLYLYCIENSLRLFIDKSLTQKYGANYRNQINISQAINKKIADRQAEEAKNKWVSLRGNSFLFYMDFKELGDIIVNNQDLSSCFPDTIWVQNKIKELGTIRNLVAHNSYISEHEKELIKVHYHSFLRQMK